MKRFISYFHQTIFLFTLIFLLPACSPKTAPIPSTTPKSIIETATALPTPTKTLSPPTETPEPIRTLFAVDPTYQIIQNSSFNTDNRDWSQRSGKLSRSTSHFYTAPSAGVIITSESGNVGVAGQCIDLREKIAEWPTTDAGKEITFAAYLSTDEYVDEASLLIIFHQGDCRNENQLHIQVGTLHTKPLISQQDWSLLSTTGVIPDDAISVDVIISGRGFTSEGRIYFDDVRTYLPEAQ